VDRRTFSRTLCSTAFAAIAAPALAQSNRRPRIVYFSTLPLTDPPSVERAAFLDALAAEGYEPGRSVDLVYASAEGNVEFAEDIARDIAAGRPDVIVASGGIALQILKKVTREIPVVMLAVGDPVGMGLADSLARPGGNFTGASFVSSDLAAKRLQLLQQVAPRAPRIGMIFDSRNANARLESEATNAAARTAGLRMIALGIVDDESLAASLRRIADAGADTLYVVFEGNIVALRRQEIAEFALARRLPSIGGWSGLADAGCLLSYGPDLAAMFERGGHYVARILRGAKPAELPIEQPSRFELVVNMKTASALHISVPRDLILRATRVIK